MFWFTEQYKNYLIHFTTTYNKYLLPLYFNPAISLFKFYKIFKQSFVKATSNDRNHFLNFKPLILS